MTPAPPKLQDLSPHDARLCLGVETFIRELLGDDAEGLSVVLAVSGGADSLALALILTCLAPRLKWRLHAAHLDHGIRPESAAEAGSAVEACARLGIACTVERVDVAALARDRSWGLEEAGRKARKQFFSRVALAQGAEVIALGHQLGDLAEDLLMRLIRGTGWPALGGMAAWNRETRVLRPLLLTEREHLEALLAARSLAFTIDPSNEDRAFFRNRVRHDLLPLLQAENPGFLKSVAGLWRLAQLDGEFFAQQLKDVNILENNEFSSSLFLENSETFSRHVAGSPDVSSDYLPIDSDTTESVLVPAETVALHQALRLRLCKRIIESVGPGQPLMTGLMQLDRAWTGKHWGSVVQFPGNKSVRVERQGLVFISKTHGRKNHGPENDE